MTAKKKVKDLMAEQANLDAAADEILAAAEAEAGLEKTDAKAGPALAEVEEPLSPEAQIIALSVERDELKDRLMRALAEAENTRKRGERDRKDAENYGGTRLARDLLSVHDNLGRALDNIGDELRECAAAFIEGVELTQRELLAAFAKHKITAVTPEPGEKFDPKLHQAMFEAPVPGSVPGAVIQVMQPGFVIADRLLRPAMVGVASAAPATEDKAAKETAETEEKTD